MAATHLNGVGNPLEAQATTLASFEPIMASPPSKRVPALRPMAKSLDSAKLHHRHIAGLHDLFGSAVAHSTDGLPARRRGTLPTSAIVQPSTAAPTTADPAAPALTGFSSSDDDEGDNNDDATTNAGPMFVHVASADLQSPAHIVATARNADALLRVHRVDPKSDAVKDCHTATHKQRASPTSHSPPADFSVGSELGKVPSSVPEPSSATHDANRAVLPPPDEPDDHLILYNPALDEFSYFKACCGVAALRLAARLQYLVELAARFILEGHDTRTSEAAHDIRVMVGDDPATWPSSMATVERIAPRVLAMRDAALDICRFGVLGVQSGAVWNRAVDTLRRHCAALPICASGDVKPGSIHHPPLTCVTFHWERIHPSTPKRQPGSGSAPPHPVDDHNDNDDDEEDDEDSWSTDEESSIPRSAVLPPIAIQTAQLDNGDNGDGWSDGGEDLQGCKTVTHSSSQANIVSIQATPTAATPGRKWSGNAGEYIEAEIRRFSARRESRLRCAPLPRLHLSLFPDTHETTRSLSRSWAQESTSSFATCGHVGMDEVLPGMFCGSREPSEDLMHLELNGITHVVSCINTQPFAESSTLSYTVLDMLDNEEQPLIAPAQLATAAIERRWLHGGENVLIHCGSGVSRAPAVTIYALCALFPELTSSTVGSILRHGRPYTLMNGGFKRQLSEAYPDHSGSHLGGTRTSSPRSSAPLRSGSVPPLNNNNNNACD